MIGWPPPCLQQQLLICSLTGFLILSGVVLREGFCQVIGELAEMDRLEQKAEEAIANDDPHGAALTIGKAALMASLLAQKEDGQTDREYYKTVEQLFRGQEEGYRALALFQQMGSHIPPPSGVCEGLIQAKNKVKEVQTFFQQMPTSTTKTLDPRVEHYLSVTEEWLLILPDLSEEFSC